MQYSSPSTFSTSHEAPLHPLLKMERIWHDTLQLCLDSRGHPTNVSECQGLFREATKMMSNAEPPPTVMLHCGDSILRVMRNDAFPNVKLCDKT